jgi:hypothetical protein
MTVNCPRVFIQRIKKQNGIPSVGDRSGGPSLRHQALERVAHRHHAPRELKFSSPEAFHAQRCAALRACTRSGREGWLGPSSASVAQTPLRMTVSSLFKSCAAAAVTAHARSARFKCSTTASYSRVKRFPAANGCNGFRISRKNFKIVVNGRRRTSGTAIPPRPERFPPRRPRGLSTVFRNYGDLSVLLSLLPEKPGK